MTNEMWTYTSYILGKLCEKAPAKCDNLPFTELSKFIFDVLWQKEKLIFYDGDKDLYDDLVYLKNIGIISLREEDEQNFDKIYICVNNKEKLNKIVEIVKNSGNVTGVKLYDEYIGRIQNALVGALLVA